MKFQCTCTTDLDDLIGHDELDGFHSGPLYSAMKQGESLELVDSLQLSAVVRTRLKTIAHGFIVIETGERLLPQEQFQLLLH